MANIIEIFGNDAHEMTKALLAEADEAGLLPDLPRGAKIALKPNLVTDSTPEQGATTHPGVLSGCLEFFREKGFAGLSVIEGSWVGARTENAFRLCGYDAVCRKYGVPFYDLKKDAVRSVETPFRPIEICARALDADLLIDLPVLKGHCQTVMTCALKNLKGCLPDREKRRFHSDGLLKPIAALGAALKPRLVIVDSICGDLNFEEGGNPVRTDRMYLTADPVLADAYGCHLMGLDMAEVPYVGLAETCGAGHSEWSEEEIVRLNEPSPVSSAYDADTGLIRRLTKEVRAKSACSACYASLVRALYQLREEGITIREPVAIGQEYRDGGVPSGIRIGVGNCCRSAEICVKGCPPSAGAIRNILEELA